MNKRRGMMMPKMLLADVRMTFVLDLYLHCHVLHDVHRGVGARVPTSRVTHPLSPSRSSRDGNV